MNSITAFLFSIILTLVIVPAPQSRKVPPQRDKNECGTVVSPRQVQAELARRDQSLRQTNGQALLTPNLNAPYYLPLTIHIVHNNAGVTGITLGEIEVTVRNLNLKWQQTGVQFFIHGEADHIYNDAFLPLPDLRGSRTRLLQTNSVPDTINIYFTGLYGFCGVSTFPADAAEGYEGIVMDFACSGADAPDVLAHEMGHYFDLYHTHDTDFGVECPTRAGGCDRTGDLLCDTPADPNLDKGKYVDSNCAYNNLAPIPGGCDSTPYNPPTRNLMSYSLNTCRYQFTPEQISKVLQTLRESPVRRNLIDHATRYVDPAAGSSAGKCSYADPCRTLAKALVAASDGDAICFKPGVYRNPTLGGRKLTLLKWGHSDKAVEFKP
ncbi:MAG TPA: M43 family zinc metalloprotease [Blastocatellia bacterium]|nr:M43 family zinc metalloprotease [Blastocatellia bacterium]HMV86206.1 M43 family zinc metalloprotease [Blastocatellia bacterium]HMX28169.1 M43 family zinc metalloprotease [Blastocatellia bacterium]HMZ21298.1 M43 family zinc metalloprotease [Blastocatellia bacterium]HNG29925.1 M43 family zinc metalloprotease [Blastocatellia bacterium]